MDATPPAIVAPAVVPPPAAAQPPPVTVIEENGEGPYYYRDVVPVFGGGFRIGNGLDMRLGVNGEDAKAVYALDILGVGRLGFGRGERVFALWPEAGYSFVGSDWHLLGAGVGPALQSNQGVSYGLVPRLLYGIAGGREAKGLRTCALLDFSSGGISLGLELAHQYVDWGDHHVHEIHLAIQSAAVWGKGDNI